MNTKGNTDSNVENIEHKQVINPYVREYMDEAYARGDQAGVEHWEEVSMQDARYQEEHSGAERTRRNLERFFNLTNASTLLAKSAIEIIDVGTAPSNDKDGRPIPTFIEIMYNWRAPTTNVLRKSRLVLPYQRMSISESRDTSDWIWYKYDYNGENIDEEKWITFPAIGPVDSDIVYKEVGDVIDEGYKICHEYADYHQISSKECADNNMPMGRAKLPEIELALNYLAIVKVITSIKRRLED